MARKFKYVEHTADVEFIAFGKSTNELFSNALYALFDVIAYTKALEKSEGKIIEIRIKEKARSLEDLLWYVLQDALSEVESMSAFAYAVDEIKIKELKGTFSCSALISAKEKVDKYSKLAVKGISKYDMAIKKGEILEARVVVDV